MRSNYVYVTHEMDVHTDLLGRLWRDGVLEEDEKIEIDVLRSPTKRCEKLLSMLRRKTQKQYEVFVEALRATNQSHVADVLRLEGSSSFCDENTTRFSRLSLAAFRGHSPGSYFSNVGPEYLDLLFIPFSLPDPLRRLGPNFWRGSTPLLISTSIICVRNLVKS